MIIIFTVLTAAQLLLNDETATSAVVFVAYKQLRKCCIIRLNFIPTSGTSLV